MTSNIDIREVKKKLMRDKYLLLMLLPGIAFFILFRYLPMGGLIKAGF
jgi:putative aldouronate transport system permease protein